MDCTVFRCRRLSANPITSPLDCALDNTSRLWFRAVTGQGFDVGKENSIKYFLIAKPRMCERDDSPDHSVMASTDSCR